MGMGFAPTWLRQVSLPASHDHFNHSECTSWASRPAHMRKIAMNWQTCHEPKFMAIFFISIWTHLSHWEMFRVEERRKILTQIFPVTGCDTRDAGKLLKHSKLQLKWFRKLKYHCNRYAYRQSTVIGILLIIAGALSIVFNIVDLAVGTKIAGTYSSYGYPNYYYESLSVTSKGVAGHGLWCGALVSISSVVWSFHFVDDNGDDDDGDW